MWRPVARVHWFSSLIVILHGEFLKSKKNSNIIAIFWQAVFHGTNGKNFFTRHPVNNAYSSSRVLMTGRTDQLPGIFLPPFLVCQYFLSLYPFLREQLNGIGHKDVCVYKPCVTIKNTRSDKCKPFILRNICCVEARQKSPRIAFLIRLSSINKEIIIVIIITGFETSY